MQRHWGDKRSFAAIWAGGLLVALAADVRADIAGLNPSVRPTNAPAITQFVKNDPWYVAALRGVEKPYAPSLYFLEQQGAWFTPFIHPGMTGPYDIRGLHQPAAPIQ